MWLKAIACAAATQLCLDFSRGGGGGGGDRLTGCFQPTPDFSFSEWGWKWEFICVLGGTLKSQLLLI